MTQDKYAPPLIISALYTYFYIAGTVERITKSAFRDYGYIMEVSVDHGIYKRCTVVVEFTQRNSIYKANQYVCGYVTLSNTYSTRGGWNRFKIATIRQQHPDLSEPVLTGLMRFENKPNVEFPDLDPMTGRGNNISIL